jgi:hypothetical protein
LTQGQVSDGVVDKMAMTFLALAEQADWDAPKPDALPTEGNVEQAEELATAVTTADSRTTPPALPIDQPTAVRLGGFVYNVELHLPESRDPAVYEALFNALKRHLLS